MNKCGLSGKALARACKCLNFDSSNRMPDLVLSFFRNFGFPASAVTKIVASDPRLLKEGHPEKIIRPKLDFLLSISQSQAEVVAIVTKNPLILTRSLENHLKPFLDLLNSVTGSYLNTVSVLKYNPYILNQNLPKNFLLNTQFLLTFGVPHSQILKLLRYYGMLLGVPHDKLRTFALKIKDMGFDLESSQFCDAIYALCFLPNSAWESRCLLFRSFGFSDQEIHSMFRKKPLFMCFTEEKITEKMEFFLNKLRWTTGRLSSCPSVLPYSLEKRTIPRCSVLQVLVSKNRTSESYMLSSILPMTEKKFIENFVTAHRDEVPEVMEAYKGKLRFDEYTFKQKGQLRLKPL
ncbi:hypothetical protein POM88_049999 [Heracleum sosnowskyi]|uniref:Uncharacterized protein n=1 Tax=Heracleum sosnowskyi TaxID=360622 RepID=A0AAD8GZ63_9APIA|nr:hypothetical protein POM88_049999 [Heracleum sosnowskyi]